MGSSGVALLWLLVAMSCLLFGMYRTVRSKDQQVEQGHGAAYCQGCGEILEQNASFCGVCGRYRREREQKRVGIQQRKKVARKPRTKH